MFRRTKKLVRRLLHRHHYDIIYRFVYGKVIADQLWEYPGILERCYCGKERCRYLVGNKSVKLDPLWIRETARMQGQCLPGDAYYSQ